MYKQRVKHISTSGNSPGNSQELGTASPVQGRNFGEARRRGRALLCGMLLVLPGLSAAPAAVTESAGRGVSVRPALLTERLPAPTLLAEERGAEARNAEVPAGEGERQEVGVAENLSELENLPGLAVSEGRVAEEKGPLSGAAKRLSNRVAAVGRGLLTPQSLLSVLSAVQSGTLGQHGEQTMQGFQDQMLNAVLDQGIDELRRGVEGNFLRNVELRYQTPLNGRSGLFSADAVFALVDQEDRALFGQVGALFGGQEGGLNLGLGYRHLIVSKRVLLGANFFFDYDTDSELQRISVGAEVRGRSLDLYMNWYHMIGGMSRLRPGVFRYTPDGFDVAVAGRMPILPWVELSGRYYHWFLEKDDIAGKGRGDAYGFNYKIALQPMPLFEVELELEDPEQGKREWGLSANLKYRFGVPLEEQLNYQRVKAHDPTYRRFERVRREYKLQVRHVRKNQAPSAVGRIPAQSVRVGGGPMSVDVASYFDDPDGKETLTYMAVSNAAGVATVSVSETTVVITPVLAGSARVTVTATDTEGAAATQAIAVTVAANQVPMKVGAIAPQSARVRDGTVTVDVAARFSDGDNDMLTYTAVSDDTEVAMASASGSIVTITLRALGSATVTVTATDTAGDAAMQEFEVTVVANQVPVTTGEIAEQSVRVRDGPVTVDVANNFRDGDGGDTLTYTAVSNDEEVATVSVSGSIVTITPVTVGSATVAVTATDGASSVPEPLRIEVVVVANQVPIKEGEIAPQSARVGGAVTVNVIENFSDGDDSDTLTYTAVSDNEEVATVSVLGSIVTITPVAMGSAMVTVTATDGVSSVPEPQRFRVTVVAADAPRILFASATSGPVQESSTDNSDVVLRLVFPDGTTFNADRTVTVALTVGGSATLTTDYTLSLVDQATGESLDTANNTLGLVIPSGNTNLTVARTLRIVTVNNVVVGQDRTVTLTLGESSSYELGTPAVHTLTIQEDDVPPMIRLNTGSPQQVEEEEGPVSIALATVGGVAWNAGGSVRVAALASGTSNECGTSLAVSQTVGGITSSIAKISGTPGYWAIPFVADAASADFGVRLSRADNSVADGPPEACELRIIEGGNDYRVASENNNVELWLLEAERGESNTPEFKLVAGDNYGEMFLEATAPGWFVPADGNQRERNGMLIVGLGFEFTPRGEGVGLPPDSVNLTFPPSGPSVSSVGPGEAAPGAGGDIGVSYLVGDFFFGVSFTVGDRISIGNLCSDSYLPQGTLASLRYIGHRTRGLVEEAVSGGGSNAICPARANVIQASFASTTSNFAEGRVATPGTGTIQITLVAPAGGGRSVRPILAYIGENAPGAVTLSGGGTNFAGANDYLSSTGGAHYRVVYLYQNLPQMAVPSGGTVTYTIDVTAIPDSVGTNARTESFVLLPSNDYIVTGGYPSATTGSGIHALTVTHEEQPPEMRINTGSPVLVEEEDADPDSITLATVGGRTWSAAGSVRVAAGSDCVTDLTVSQTVDGTTSNISLTSGDPGYWAIPFAADAASADFGVRLSRANNSVADGPPEACELRIIEGGNDYLVAPENNNVELWLLEAERGESETPKFKLVAGSNYGEMFLEATAPGWFVLGDRSPQSGLPVQIGFSFTPQGHAVGVPPNNSVNLTLMLPSGPSVSNFESEGRGPGLGGDIGYGYRFRDFFFGVRFAVGNRISIEGLCSDSYIPQGTLVSLKYIGQSSRGLVVTGSEANAICPARANVIQASFASTTSNFAEGRVATPGTGTIQITLVAPAGGGRSVQPILAYVGGANAPGAVRLSHGDTDLTGAASFGGSRGAHYSAVYLYQDLPRMAVPSGGRVTYTIDVTAIPDSVGTDPRTESFVLLPSNDYIVTGGYPSATTGSGIHALTVTNEEQPPEMRINTGSPVQVTEEATGPASITLATVGGRTWSAAGSVRVAAGSDCVTDLTVSQTVDGTTSNISLTSGDPGYWAIPFAADAASADFGVQLSRANNIVADGPPEACELRIIEGGNDYQVAPENNNVELWLLEAERGESNTPKFKLVAGDNYGEMFLEATAPGWFVPGDRISASGNPMEVAFDITPQGSAIGSRSLNIDLTLLLPSGSSVSSYELTRGPSSGGDVGFYFPFRSFYFGVPFAVGNRISVANLCSDSYLPQGTLVALDRIGRGRGESILVVKPNISVHCPAKANAIQASFASPGTSNFAEGSTTTPGTGTIQITLVAPAGGGGTIRPILASIGRDAPGAVTLSSDGQALLGASYFGRQLFYLYQNLPQITVPAGETVIYTIDATAIPDSVGTNDRTENFVLFPSNEYIVRSGENDSHALTVTNSP